MTAFETATSKAPLLDIDQSVPTLLVAVDGTETSSAALTAAKLIAEINDVDVRVVSVIEPLSIPMTTPHALLDFRTADAARVRDLTNRVKSQVAEFESAIGAWTIESRLGSPAEEIVQSARDHSARMVIVGANHHALLDRIIGEETAAKIAQLGRISLLAAEPGLKRLPHRVAVAMDLDPSQLGDLSPVLSLLGRTSTIACVHVQRPENFPGSDSPAFRRAYESAVTESFAVTRDALSRLNGARAELIRLTGDPAGELLRYADLAKTELIVLGLRRHFGLRRLLGGGVALKVLREARCSVLIVPETAVADAAARKKDGITTTVIDDSTLWSSELQNFTTRNAGRHASLEVDGRTVGAVVQLEDLPFIGADYDHRDGRVGIMLGDFSGSERHFARSIQSPDSISIMRNGDAKDEVLRVGYAEGQTLLRFKS